MTCTTQRSSDAEGPPPRPIGASSISALTLRTRPYAHPLVILLPHPSQHQRSSDSAWRINRDRTAEPAKALAEPKVGRAEVVEVDALAREYTAILEYELPMESRRPDVVLLVSGAVVVLELKGKTEPDQADLD